MRRIQLDDPDLPLKDLMSQWPKTIPVFIRHGMLCVGCFVSPFHTITDACAAYNLDVETFLAEILVASELV